MAGPKPIDEGWGEETDTADATFMIRGGASAMSVIVAGPASA